MGTSIMPSYVVGQPVNGVGAPSMLQLNSPIPFVRQFPNAFALKQPAQIASTQKSRRSAPLICRAAAFQPAICGAAAGTPSQEPSLRHRLTTAFTTFLDANFITVGLLSAITLGWCFPAPGTAASAMNLQPVSTIGIFIISGILLQKGEMMAALKSLPAIVYGLAAILLITPLAAFGVLQLPLQPPEMALGLAVFCCMPTTLSTGVTLSNASGGNVAVALLLTVASNLLGVFTIPLLLPFILGAGAGIVNFASGQLFKTLVLTVLLPLLFGASLQVIFPRLPDWRATNRKKLSYLSAFFLCLVPWMQISKAASSQLPLPPACIAAAALAGAAIHVIYLILNTTIAAFIPFNSNPEKNEAIRKAVVLCTSEKTLPVAVAVISQLAVVAGPAAGCAVVPCILAHLIQIAMDSTLVGHWNKKKEKLTLA